MEQYVAFLRAINVSGHRLIKMEELRRIMTGMPGVANVRTYIQSGNVLFESKEKDEAKLTAKIGKQLVKELGFEVEVFLRTKAELEDILSNNPFKKAALGKDLALYITFLTEAPDPEQRKAFESHSNQIDTFKILDRDVFALVIKDGSKSLFSNMFVERKLKQMATGRNQTTLHKILDMFEK